MVCGLFFLDCAFQMLMAGQANSDRMNESEIHVRISLSEIKYSQTSIYEKVTSRKVFTFSLQNVIDKFWNHNLVSVYKPRDIIFQNCSVSLSLFKVVSYALQQLTSIASCCFPWFCCGYCEAVSTMPSSHVNKCNVVNNGYVVNNG